MASSSSRISLTPAWHGPCSLIWLTGIRMVIPDSQVIIRSCFSVTSSKPTNPPVLSVTLIVLHPYHRGWYAVFLPRRCVFPYPFHFTASIVRLLSSRLTQTSPTTSSFHHPLQCPVTPCPPRPVLRTVSSGKRMARPLFTAIGNLAMLPSVIRQPATGRLRGWWMALMPVCLGRLKSSRSVFLIIPFLVQSTI